MSGKFNPEKDNVLNLPGICSNFPVLLLLKDEEIGKFVSDN